jgi:F420-dependent oxidoreductase-like protein
MHIGVFFPTKEYVPVDEMTARFRTVADLGFSSIWLPQSAGFDALTLIAISGAHVPRVDFGTSVVPTYPRHPIALAAQALTVNAAVGGRLLLGLGLSHRMSIEGSYGLSYERPARHMRDYLAALLPLLEQGAVDVSGDTISARATLNTPGALPPPVLLAALQPRMLQLAGAVASGTITWCTGPVTLAEQVVPLLRSAAEAAGRPAPRVVVALPAIVTDDEADGRAKADAQLAGYGDIPVYRAVLDREGVAGPADVSIVGDEGSVASQLGRLAEIGATDFVAIPTGDDADRRRTLEHLASLVPETVA